MWIHISSNETAWEMPKTGKKRSRKQGKGNLRERMRADARGSPIWNRPGCSSEILNLTPKGDHLGVAQGFCDP